MRMQKSKKKKKKPLHVDHTLTQDAHCPSTGYDVTTRVWWERPSLCGLQKGGEQDSRLPCTVLVTAWIKSLPVGQNSSGQAMTHGDYLMQTQTTEHRTSTVISTLLLAQLPPAVAVLVFSVCLFFSKTGSRRYTDLSNRVLKQREKTRL